MAAEYSVALAIRAADYATAPIRAVTARLEALKGSIVAFGRENLATGHLVNALQGVRQASAGVASHINSVLKPAIAALGLGGVGSAMGLWHLMRASAETGAAMKELSDRVGLPVERMKEWSYAAKQFGIDSETMANAITMMARGIGQAVNGTGKAKDVFVALGIGLTDAKGRVRATDAVMRDLAERMEKIPSAAERAAVATAIFGKQGAALAPMFAEGGAKLEEFFARSRRFGVISDEAAAASEKFNRTVNDLDMAAGGFGRTIATKLIPVVTPLVEQLTEWMIANRQIVASQITEVVKTIAEGVRAIDLTGAVKGTLDFIRGITEAVRVVGGLKPVLIAVAAVMMAGPVVSVLHLVKAFGLLGIAVTETGARMAVVMGGQVLGAVVSFVQALRSGIGVMLSLNFAMAANPIGVIVLGIGAAVAGVVALYNAWTPFHEFVDRTWARIKELVASLGGWAAQKLGINIAAFKSDPEVQEKTAAGGETGKTDADKVPPAMPKMPGLPQQGGKAENQPRMPELPPSVTGKAEVSVRILSEAPAKVESIKQSGGNLTVSTDLDVGRGSVAR